MTTSRFHFRQGSSLIESCIVMALLCLVLFGLLQVSQVVAAHSVVNHGAIATARAAAVGLNDFMLHKVSHYAAIPLAGPDRTLSDGMGEDRPAGARAGVRWSNAVSRNQAPVSRLGRYEVGVREAYHLASTRDFRQILDYDNWDGGDAEIRIALLEHDNDDVLTLEVEQTVPLTMPFARVFFGYLDLVEVSRAGRTERFPGQPLRATAYIEDHSKYYLKDSM